MINVSSLYRRSFGQVIDNPEPDVPPLSNITQQVSMS